VKLRTDSSLRKDRTLRTDRTDRTYLPIPCPFVEVMYEVSVFPSG